MRTEKENVLVVVIDFQEKLMPAINNNENLEKKAKTFIKACKVLDVPILVTQQNTKGLGNTIPLLHEALEDYEYIEKMTFSCWGTKEFVDKLKIYNRKDIIVIGTEAHICVQQTVLDLLENGYNVFVMADCIGSRFKIDQLYAEKRMHQAGAIITTIESILFELMVDANNPKRKEISALIK